MPSITATGEALPAIKQVEVNIGVSSACWNSRHARILSEKVSFWREKETGFHGKIAVGAILKPHLKKPRNCAVTLNVNDGVNNHCQSMNGDLID